MQKPGYKTTEFWASMGSLAIAALVQLGLVPAELSENEHVAGVAGATLGAVYLVGQYITGRAHLKAGQSQDPAVPALIGLLARSLDERPGDDETHQRLAETAEALISGAGRHNKGVGS